MTKALITGIRGQDGAYLVKFLLERSYKVYANLWRLKELGIEKHVDIVYIDLLEFTNIARVIRDMQPDEVYNLAA
jgi:GDP-D-mannose dehydratase